MASDVFPTHDGGMKKKDRLKIREAMGQESLQIRVDIEGLTASGHNALLQGNCEEALDCFKKAFKASLELKESRVQRACAFNLGAAYVESGKPQKGLDFLKRAQPGERGERVADLQFNLGAAHEALGEPVRAARHYLQAAQLYRSQGEGCSEGDACVKLAHCHLLVQDWTQAAQSYQRAGESYKLASRLDSAVMALKEAGDYMLQSRDFSMEDIISVLNECLVLSANIKDKDTLGKLYNDIGLCFSQLKRFQEAASCFEQALPLVYIESRRLAVVLQNLGAVYNTQGLHQQALEYHREAATLHGSLGSRSAQGQCFSNLAFALSQLGEHEEAGENYLHALQAFKDTDDHSGQWQVCEGLGVAKFLQGDPEKATLYYKQALGLLSKCKDSPSSIQERLVNKLTDALRYKLSLQSHTYHGRGLTPALPQRRPYRDQTLSHRTSRYGILHKQAPLRVASIQAAKPSKLLQPLSGPQVQGLDFNRRPKKEPNDYSVTHISQGAMTHMTVKGKVARASGEIEDSDTATTVIGSDSPSSELNATQPNHRTVPEANSNLNNTYLQPDPNDQTQTLSGTLELSQCSKHSRETIKQKSVGMNSDPPLLPSEQPFPEKRDRESVHHWKSAVCAVM